MTDQKPPEKTSASENIMFKVPFKHYSLGDWKDRKDKLVAVLPKDLGTDFFDNKEKGIPKYMDTVGEVIADCMQDFSQFYPCPVMVTSVWYARGGNMDAHAPHNHGATGYSAILYVDFDPFVHEPTRFFSPFSDPANGDMIDFQPVVKEGDLVVFPSFVLHEAPPNKSDKPRTIVSFNIMGEDVMKAYYSGLEKQPLSKEKPTAGSQRPIPADEHPMVKDAKKLILP